VVHLFCIFFVWGGGGVHNCMVYKCSNECYNPPAILVLVLFFVF